MNSIANKSQKNRGSKMAQNLHARSAHHAQNFEGLGAPKWFKTGVLKQNQIWTWRNKSLRVKPSIYSCSDRDCDDDDDDADHNDYGGEVVVVLVLVPASRRAILEIDA